MNNKKIIVIFYSNKGSNSYLAAKIAGRLECDIEELKPRMNIFLFFLMNIHLGNRRLKHNIKDYDKVILCGPIWVGKLIPPLKSFLTGYRDSINELVFVTCCGSSDTQRDEKFGHGLVFKKVEAIMKDKCTLCQAFPIGLIVPDELKEDPKTVMETRLSDENFTGAVAERFESFIKKLEE